MPPMAIAALVLLPHCAGQVSAAALPSTHPPPTVPHQRTWSGFDQGLGYPADTQGWFVSHGHYAETSLARVLVSPNALEAYHQHTKGAEFEPGTTLVMLHKSRADGKPGKVHVMHRGKSGWEYLLLQADGGVIEEGALPRCARCHAEAVADSVFGPPQSGE